MQPKVFLIIALICSNAFSAEKKTYPLNTVVATLGPAIITLQDVDAMAFQLPDDVRAGVFDSPKRIGDSLETMLVRRAIVTPVLEVRPDYLNLEDLIKDIRRKTLIREALRVAVERQPLPDFEAQAQALYDDNPSQFLTPEAVSVRHVLVGVEKRDQDAAFSLATRLRAQLLEGSLRFDDAVTRYSDDEAKSQNQGRYPRVSRGQMVPPFEDAAFSLETPGEISHPVHSEFGYHIILLEDRHPPKQEPRNTVVSRLVEQYSQEHRRTKVTAYLRELGPDAESKLLEMAEEEQVFNSERFTVQTQLALEEEVLKAYREHYLKTHLTGEFDVLAKEYYLTHKEEFQSPKAISALQIELPKTQSALADMADALWIRHMASSLVGAQIVLAFTPVTARAEQVTYLVGDPNTARATKIASGLTRPGECSDIVDQPANFVIVCLIRKHPAMTKPFLEVRNPLVARLRRNQENLLWRLHLNEYHQLPFHADPEVVASLRTRYAFGNHGG